LVVTIWSIALGLVLSPLFALLSWEPVHYTNSWLDFVVTDHPWAVRLGTSNEFWHWTIDTPLEVVLIVLVGLFVFFLTPWMIRGLANANRALVLGMLGRDMTD